jgi:hypothetical protein
MSKKLSIQFVVYLQFDHQDSSPLTYQEIQFVFSPSGYDALEYVLVQATKSPYYDPRTQWLLNILGSSDYQTFLELNITFPNVEAKKRFIASEAYQTLLVILGDEGIDPDGNYPIRNGLMSSRIVSAPFLKEVLRAPLRDYDERTKLNQKLLGLQASRTSS